MACCIAITLRFPYRWINLAFSASHLFSWSCLIGVHTTSSVFLIMFVWKLSDSLYVWKGIYSALTLDCSFGWIYNARLMIFSVITEGITLLSFTIHLLKSLVGIWFLYLCRWIYFFFFSCDPFMIIWSFEIWKFKICFYVLLFSSFLVFPVCRFVFLKLWEKYFTVISLITHIIILEDGPQWSLSPGIYTLCSFLPTLYQNWSLWSQSMVEVMEYHSEN